MNIKQNLDKKATSKISVPLAYGVGFVRCSKEISYR